MLTFFVVTLRRWWHEWRWTRQSLYVPSARRWR